MNISKHREIKLLASELSNQIAAGEVIERPAGVLKELLENSLDAGATDIYVSIEGGGQSLLAVRDDGTGIPEAELLLAIQRHATSKVRSFAELLRVASYGFRGEALPSIASVSELRLESAFQSEDGKVSASYIHMRHGKFLDQRPSALLKGTLVEVRELFSNVPARLKFLKSPATELKRCRECLARTALARLDVGFVLNSIDSSSASTIKNREILRLRAHESLLQRLCHIWPVQITDELFPFSLERNDLKVHGLAARPQSAQTGTERMLFYVNNRPVNNRVLLQAVRQAYRGRLTSRENPQLVLFLEINPDEVDVNVHPAKTEVRFRDERSVFSFVMRAIEASLPNVSSAETSRDSLNSEYTARPQGFWGSMDNSRIVNISTQAEQEDISLFESSDLSELQTLHPDPLAADGVTVNPDNSASGTQLSRVGIHDYFCSPAYALNYGRCGDSASASVYAESASIIPCHSNLLSDEVKFSTIDTFAAGDSGGNSYLASASLGNGYPIHVCGFTCLCQFANCYLLLLAKDVFLLVDQHAAHERILYNQFLRQARSHECQLLTTPALLRLQPEENESLQGALPSLTRLGFALKVITDSGDSIAEVSGVPPLLGLQRGLDLLQNIILERKNGFSEILQSMACRAAIKAGDKLTADEAAGLISQWHVETDSDFCPHGRPTVLQFSTDVLDKLFKRKVG